MKFLEIDRPKKIIQIIVPFENMKCWETNSTYRCSTSAWTAFISKLALIISLLLNRDPETQIDGPSVDRMMDRLVRGSRDLVGSLGTFETILSISFLGSNLYFSKMLINFFQKVSIFYKLEPTCCLPSSGWYHWLVWWLILISWSRWWPMSWRWSRFSASSTVLVNFSMKIWIFRWPSGPGVIMILGGTGCINHFLGNIPFMAFRCEKLFPFPWIFLVHF